MNFFNRVLLILQIAVITSCGSKETTVPVRTALLTTKYLTEKDSIFITDVADMELTDNGLMISEYQRSRVLVFDNGFRLDTIIGTYGQGPDEFLNAGDVGFWNDNFFVHDVFHGLLRVFDSSYQLKRDVQLHYPDDPNNFLISDSVIYYTATDGKGLPIVSIDLKTNETRRHGEILAEGIDVFQKVNRSQGFVFEVEDKVVFFHKTEPIVSLYDYDFKLISSLNFSDLGLIENSIERASLTYNKLKNTTVFLFKDIYQKGNFFYLATYEDYKTDDSERNFGYRRELNSLIEIELIKEQQTFQVHSIIDLSDGGGWYNQIVVKGNTILAFDAVNNEIHEFKVD